LSSWDYTIKDGRTVTIKHAVVKDARYLLTGFCDVVDEGKWLPTFEPNATLIDWVNWIERTFKTRDILLIARINDTYVGHLTLQPEEWEASKHVAKLGIIVAAGYRNHGIGHALMLAAEEAGKQQRYEKIVLSTFHNNSIARGLYESVGYVTVGVRKRHFKMPAKGYIDEILMEKAID
jgi:ribosomal protein S18 acetylase RimI-like enzyme